MSLSIFTSASSMASMNALNQSNNVLSTAMERLGTGKRINSAADDAAGLQIASRLEGQSRGMSVAQRNIADATALLQVGEGAFDEATNILHRMKDWATQSANDTNSVKDREAINVELTELFSGLGNLLGNTSFAGEKLLGEQLSNGNIDYSNAKLYKDMNIQIGASADEHMTVEVGLALDTAMIAIYEVTANHTDANGAFNISDASGAQSLINELDEALEESGQFRSDLGATINRLGHTSANLANMKDNTDLALGNIQDADYAAEASSMSRSQLLSQTSMSMLKQSNSMQGMVMSLLG